MSFEQLSITRQCYVYQVFTSAKAVQLGDHVQRIVVPFQTEVIGSHYEPKSDTDDSCYNHQTLYGSQTITINSTMSASGCRYKFNLCICVHPDNSVKRIFCIKIWTLIEYNKAQVIILTHINIHLYASMFALCNFKYIVVM